MKAALSATWILEIAIATVSVLALGALVGLLASADGRTLYAWHSITLNTVALILSTVSKMAATFILCAAIAQSKWIYSSRGPSSLLVFEAVEQASLGPLGAIQLLFKTRTIALIGLLTTIVAVAFDPFVQNLVQFTPDLVPHDNDIAYLPRAQRYSAGNRNVIQAVGNGFNLGAIGVAATPEYPMQAAILYGLTLSTEQATQQLDLSCLTGNCSYPTTQLLAVCSLCNDVLSYVEWTDSTNNQPTWESLYGVPESGDRFPVDVTALTLPNGLFIDNQPTYNPAMYMTAWGTAIPAETVTMGDLDTLLWSTTMIRVTNNSMIWPSDNSSRDWSSSVEASECALYYCVNSYDTAVVNNTIRETSAPVPSATRSPQSWQTPSADPGYLSNISNSLEFLWPQNAIDRTDLMLGDGFNISQTAIAAIGSFFQAIFAQNLTSTFEADYNINGYCFTYSGLNFNTSAMQALYNSPNLTATWDAVAKSMTASMRSNADNQTTVAGSTLYLTTKYRIVWAWISIPAIVVAGSILQLCITMFTNGDTPLFKSSTLATISRGYVIGDIFAGSSSIKDMERVAQEHRPHLFGTAESPSASTGAIPIADKFDRKAIAA